MYLNPRQIISPEVVTLLDSWLPREITDEVFEYLIARPQEVAGMYHGHLEFAIVKDNKVGTTVIKIKKLDIRLKYKFCPNCEKRWLFEILWSKKIEIAENLSGSWFHHGCDKNKGYMLGVRVSETKIRVMYYGHKSDTRVILYEF